MDVRITRSEFAGRVTAPPSKSYTQRAVACALLAEGRSEVICPSRSDDALRALQAARMLGARVADIGDRWAITGGAIRAPGEAVDCGGSATALRLFTAISAYADGPTTLTGNEQLRRRPMGALLVAMNSLGARCLSKGGSGLPPVVVLGGGAEGGSASIRGDVSSQFISALLIMCTHARRDATIRLTSPLESSRYVDMTIEVLRAFGAEAVFHTASGLFTVPGRQPLRPASFEVEGDFSSAAFMLAAGALCGAVEVRGIRLPSLQGDVAAVDMLRRMGAATSCTSSSVTAAKSPLKGIEIDAAQVPDLVPVLAAVAAKAEGETKITGIRRLRYKESDRIATTAETLIRMGASIKTGDDWMTIRGAGATRGATIDPAGDHRIAMACAVLALASDGVSVIKNAECVSKSYPSFFEDLAEMGANVELVS
ncbi:MAG TPA: 3-phosphoshikimate 1-carboxyvinyltransferase [Candidatus Methanomethylicus sp.]|nr:3-phosphoshikimate 1-carboxyvinyltransferase [Candidatus Methanomethylicus sp.]